MLIAIFAFLFMGGSTFGLLDFIEEKESLIDTVVTNEGKRENALSIIKTIKSKAVAFREEQSSTVEKAKNLMNQNTNTDEIDKLWSAHFEKYTQHNSEMLDLRFKLKKQITEQEWAAIFVAANR